MRDFAGLTYLVNASNRIGVHVSPPGVMHGSQVITMANGSRSEHAVIPAGRCPEHAPI